MTTEEVKKMFNNMLNATQYCKEDKREQWTTLVSNAIASEQDEEMYDVELGVLDNAASIMRYLAEGATWEDIKLVVARQGHTGYSFSSLGHRMLQFSPQGIAYAENIIGPRILNTMKGLNQAYVKAIDEQAMPKVGAKKQ